MNKILGYLSRIFARHRRPARQIEYLRERDLPANPGELARRGTIKLWRRAADGELWYRIPAEPIDGNDGGPTDVC